MIAVLLGGFITILVGVSLLGPLATEIQGVAGVGSSVYNSSAWGSNVMMMIPGFFAIGILSVGVAIMSSVFRQAGII